jgi:hypothetical protein
MVVESKVCTNSDLMCSLNQIVRDYSYVFLDTNILLNISSLNLKDTPEDRLETYRIRECLFDFWSPVILENPQIYLTKKVFNELNRDHYNYREDLRNNRNSRKVYTDTRRIKKKLKNKGNKFIDEFPRERILDRETLEDKSLYDSLYKKYFYCTNLCGGIGETDLDLIVIGGVFSKINNNSAVVSNDSGVRDSWRRFLGGEMISRHNYRLYSQRGINFFKREFCKQ